MPAPSHAELLHDGTMGGAVDRTMERTMGRTMARINGQPAGRVMAFRCAMVLGAIALVLAALAGCSKRSPVPGAALAEPEPDRFPHDRHDQLACTDCHALDAVLRGAPAVPGASDHAPCDRSGCHQAQFLAMPGPLCAICHERVDPAHPGQSPLLPYPPRHGQRALASAFSHKKHLDFDAMERQVGFHVSCTDCHPAGTAGEPGQPDHTVCSRCHAPEAVPEGVPAMDTCARCHRTRRRKPSRQRRMITGDLHFRHKNHQNDRRGKLIRCVECHAGSPDTVTVTEHPTPPTQACVTCHDNPERTPPAMRMRVCETCHTTRARTFQTLAPRSHLPPQERPEDHTLAFRRDHGADARGNAGRCARCHTFMSGATRDVCDECHQVMRPHDHVVTWREYDHGPAASARADRCATCHTGTFCAVCHSRPPRSHLPLAMFRQGGHGMPARINIRACMTCHDPDTMCSTCHVLGVMR